MATETATDMGIGLSVLFSLVAVLAAFGMYAGAPDDLAAWAFGGAMVFGALAVFALHAYEH